MISICSIGNRARVEPAEDAARGPRPRSACTSSSPVCGALVEAPEGEPQPRSPSRGTGQPGFQVDRASTAVGAGDHQRDAKPRRRQHRQRVGQREGAPARAPPGSGGPRRTRRRSRAALAWNSHSGGRLPGSVRRPTVQGAVGAGRSGAARGGWRRLLSGAVGAVLGVRDVVGDVGRPDAEGLAGAARDQPEGEQQRRPRPPVVPSRRRGETGSVTRTVVPDPSTEETSIRPSCRATIRAHDREPQPGAGSAEGPAGWWSGRTP